MANGTTRRIVIVFLGALCLGVLYGVGTAWGQEPAQLRVGPGEFPEDAPATLGTPMQQWVVIAVGITLVLFTVLLHYEALRLVSLALARMSHVPRVAVAMLIIGLLFVHQLEVWIFGVGYYALTSDGEYGLLVGREIGTIIDYVYFSLVTYTTLGYGDIIPLGPIRFISAAEALTGMVLVAWSASFTFLEMQRFWKIRSA